MSGYRYATRLMAVVTLGLLLGLLFLVAGAGRLYLTRGGGR